MRAVMILSDTNHNSAHIQGINLMNDLFRGSDPGTER